MVRTEGAPSGPLVRSAWPLPPLLALAWCLAVGHQGLHGQDGHDYLRVARAWAAWLHGGPTPEATEHPQAFPFLGALLGTTTGDPLSALRILAFAALPAIVLLMGRTLRRQAGGPWAGMLLLVASSPFLLRHACTVMSDLPALAWCAGGWACLVRWDQERRPLSALLFVLLAAAACLTRYAAAPLLVGGVVAVLWPHVRPVVRWAGVAVLLVGFTLLAAMAEEHVWRFTRTDTPLVGWSPLNALRTVLHSDDGELRYAVPNAINVLKVFVHPGFLLLGPVLLPFVRRGDLRAGPQRIALGMTVGYLLFVAGIPFQNDRVLLLAQPFVAVLFMPALHRAVAWTRDRWKAARLLLVAVVLVQSALFVRAMLPFMRQELLERHWASAVCATGASRVYTHGLGGAITSWCPRIQVTELWYAPIERFEPGALVLVQPFVLRHQWTGLNPWTNYLRAQRQGLRTMVEGPDGWALFEVRAVR
ncbi:MAG: hypothetical protein JNL05_11390 [Flavobacteriales bacterium]|nr:hypothetical protein [Flavobacteriales bacterium]